MKKDYTRINNQIRAKELRVLLEDGDNLGVLSREDALRVAQEKDLDLIEISPNTNPPVAKIMDYGKFQYDLKKKLKASKAKASTTETKVVQVKMGTGNHDLELKAKNISKWLSQGNRVKLDLFLRGREKYMDKNFLKERMDRVCRLISVDYKLSGEPQKSPKGLTVILEKGNENK